MYEKYVGYSEAKHTAQPKDSDLCFAACVASVAGCSLEAVHSVLKANRLPKENGETDAPWQQKQLEIHDKILTIEPVQSPMEGETSVRGIEDLINKQLVRGNPVVLLYKKTDIPNHNQMHYSVITGYFEQEGDTSLSIDLIDPLAAETKYVDPVEVHNMIERSMTIGGPCAYALITE